MALLIMYVYSFECDVQGCGKTEDVLPQRGPNQSRQARQMARAAGWTVGQVRDPWAFCPAHTIQDPKTPTREVSP